MYGTVPETRCMDDMPGAGIDDAVVLIDDVEQFIIHRQVNWQIGEAQTIGKSGF